jgi:hypothetical protein
MMIGGAIQSWSNSGDIWDALSMNPREAGVAPTNGGTL